MEKRDSSAFAETARARKVVALLRVVPQGRTQIENDFIALFLESLTSQQRAVFDVLANLKNPASDETWRMTIAAVRARHVPGDGGSLERRDLPRPDFSDAIRRQHRVHPDLPPERAPNGCVACLALADTLNRAFDDGVTAAVRAVGL
jgi:hypothetical protein